MQSSFLGAYWGDRPESSGECGKKLAQYVEELAGIDQSLTNWFQKGSRRGSTTEPVKVDAGSLGTMLRDGVNRRDMGEEAIDQLGFSVALWNRAEPAVSLSMHVGSYAGQPGVLNSLVMNFPAPHDSAEALYRPSSAEAIFESAVSIWRPEWATWTTHEWRDIQSPAPREPIVGWLTYIRGSCAQDVPSLDTKELHEGVLIRSADSFAGVSQQRLIDVRESLRKSSQLRPIR